MSIRPDNPQIKTSNIRTIGFLIYDGVSPLDFTGPAEAFSRSNGYELIYLSPSGGNIHTASGITIADTLPATSINPATLDTLIITGSDSLPQTPLKTSLIDAARHLVCGPRRVATVCTGAFILAELGLLNGREATTHWKNARDLARRYPQIRVRPDIIHVHDGRFVTSAGITAGIDLALSLIEEDQGAHIARDTARDMVVYMHRPGGQSQFATTTEAPSVSHPSLQKAIDHVFGYPAASHSAASLADYVSVSQRHLTRIFQSELGLSPAQWLEQFRLNTAQQLILNGESISTTAGLSGFGSEDSLRRAFSKWLHITPSEYRARFRSTFPAH